MDNIYVRQYSLPMHIYGFTKLDSDGDYNVYINSDINEELKTKALKHELKHIKLNHFYRNISAEECEREVNNCD